MNWWSPEFVLAIIGMSMVAGVLKSWARAAHGIDRKGRRQKAAPDDQGARLQAENERLRERLELHEDRLIALEAIVTDSGFDVAHQIERLRDRPTPRIEASRDRANS